MDEESPLRKWLKEEMRKGLAAELAKAPWWCLLCGQGGNYEGERPDEYWFPPEDHVCEFKVTEMKPVGGVLMGWGEKHGPDEKELKRRKLEQLALVLAHRVAIHKKVPSTFNQEMMYKAADEYVSFQAQM